jgi:hypothetical protein
LGDLDGGILNHESYRVFFFASCSLRLLRLIEMGKVTLTLQKTSPKAGRWAGKTLNLPARSRSRLPKNLFGEQVGEGRAETVYRLID